ncbi:hypothetical protein LEP1GSC133_0354 [Leptospira borgpetersenii serovar Pomona str. 200901868]|nr:hypothetical protein LEP1GSC133_0354 [Leptospira borgpetersenii serovar Pomona str. 200901868]
MLINDSTLIGLNGLEKLSGFERLTIDASTLLKGDLFKNLKLAKHLILYRDTVPEDLVIEKVDSKEIKLILNKIKGNIVIKSCNIRKVFLNGNSAYKVIFVDSKIGTVELLDNLFRSYEIESINSTVDTFKKSEALDPVQNPQQKIRNPNTKL